MRLSGKKPWYELCSGLIHKNSFGSVGCEIIRPSAITQRQITTVKLVFDVT